MKIGLDCRLSGKKYAAGIGRYIENLAVNLPVDNQKHKWVYFFRNQKQAEEVLQQIPDELQSQIKIIITPIRHYSLAEQVKWPQILRKEKLDLLHVPHFNIPLLYGGKIVTTIHDLLWHQQIGPEVTTLPAATYYFKYLAYRLVTHQAVHRSQKIFVPTKTIKKTITKYYPEVEDRIIVTLEGISPHFAQLVKKKNTAKIKKNQLVYVGSLYPHKNVELILQAMTKMPILELVIVSARNAFSKRFLKQTQKYGLEQRVTLTGYLSDKDLVKTIQQSLALIQPSLSEGFGLTGIEAMAAGTPVLASDIDVFHEIYQDAPLYFDPQQVEELIQTLKNIQQSKTRNTQINKGKKIAQQYSWKKMAKLTKAGYEQV